MKRIVKKICTLLVALLLAVNIVPTVYAAGTVTYDGDAHKFIFAPGSDYSPTDLFSDFKNVMPGDTLTEQILIKNDTPHSVKVYMRSFGAQENTDKFLNQMNLTVKQKDDSILFEASADETAQLTEWVCLGTIYSDAEIPLDIMLEVPITMGNDYQNVIGYIDWEFKIEELPEEPSGSELPNDSPDSEESEEGVVVALPKTGDSSPMLLYSILAIISSIALFVLVVFKARENKKRTES